MIFEIFTIFVPIFHIVKLRIMSKRAADSSAKWETASQTSTLRPSTLGDGKFTIVSAAEKGEFFDYLDETLGDRLLTMVALDHVLNNNPTPLQEFSALSDFSGENIAFLTRASSWKASWPRIDRQEAFNRALGIYADFISPRDAEFPLNLPSQDLKQLEHVFEKSVRAVLGEASVSLATPFDDPSPGSSRNGSCDPKADTPIQFSGEVPNAFDVTTFDKAITHIKYLVLTNTWPKFVAEMQRRHSGETERSDFSAGSGTTLASRVSSKVSTVVRKLF